MGAKGKGKAKGQGAGKGKEKGKPKGKKEGEPEHEEPAGDGWSMPHGSASGGHDWGAGSAQRDWALGYGAGFKGEVGAASDELSGAKGGSKPGKKGKKGKEQAKTGLKGDARLGTFKGTRMGAMGVDSGDDYFGEGIGGLDDLHEYQDGHRAGRHGIVGHDDWGGEDWGEGEGEAAHDEHEWGEDDGGGHNSYHAPPQRRSGGGGLCCFGGGGGGYQQEEEW